MAHNIETMMYNEVEKPWHGLGNAVDTTKMSTDECLTTAMLNWLVERRYVRMRESRENENYIAIPGYCAIVRQSDGKVFQIASDRYHPVQNKQMFEVFKETCNEGGLHIETAGSLKGGGVIWVLAKLNSGTDFTLGAKDKVASYVLLANSHDGSMPYTGMFTSVRVVCWNTLSAALAAKDKMFRIKHSAKKDKIAAAEDSAKKQIANIRLQAVRFHETAEKLSSAKVDFQGQAILDYVYQVTGGKLLEVVVDQATTPQDVSIASLIASTEAQSQIAEGKKVSKDDLGRVGRMVLDSILTSPGSDLDSAKDKWWGAVNGVSYYTDHLAGRNADNRLTSAWFGARADMKETALELAVQYAERGVN